MPQSFSKIILHIVFSTKQRMTMIKPDIEPELYAYVAKLCKEQECPAYKIGGIDDHIHICCLLARTVEVSGWLKRLNPIRRNG